MPATDVDISILGGVSLRDRVGVEHPVAGSQRAKILAVLAAERDRPVLIERLVSMLWTKPPPTATKTIRVQIGQLRRRLGAIAGVNGAEIIATEPSAYRLAVAPHQIDIDRFRSLVRQGNRQLKEPAYDRAADCYREALDLWRDTGPTDLVGVPGCEPLVAELAALALAAEEGRLLGLLETGEPGIVASEIGALLTREPLREELYGLGMLALYRIGRQVDALALFQQARQALVTELGIDPSQKLQELEVAILRQDAQLTLVAPAARIDPRRGAFIGRTHELVRLQEEQRLAVKGRGRVVLVGGEPGIGKTRLVREFVERAEENPISLWASCRGGDGATPLGAIDTLLRRAEEAGLAAAEEVPILRTRIARVDDDSNGWTTGSGSADRLVSDMVAALRRIGAGRVMILVFDDLHEIDSASAAVFLALSEEIRADPILLLGTYRDVDSEQSQGLRGVLPNLSRLGHETELELDPLSRAATAQYLEIMRGGELESRVVDDFWSRTRGNLLFTVELAPLLGSSNANEPLPDALRQFVQARLEDVPSASREVAEILAVVGHASLARMGGLLGDPSEAADALDDLERRRLAVASDSGFEFTHDLVRESVYDALSPSRRRALHLAAAAALESSTLRTDASTYAGATHRLAGLPAEPDRCIDACLGAGRLALGLPAFGDAARWFGAARSSCEHLPDDLARVLSSELGLGETLMRSGDPGKARLHLDEAARLARETREPEQLGRAAFFAAADRIPTPTEDPATFDLLVEADAMLGDVDTELKVRVLDLISVAFHQSDRGAAVRHADEALERARRTRNPKIEALALNGRVMAAAGPDDVADRILWAEAALDAAKRSRDLESVMVSRVNRLLALLELGRVFDADAEVEIISGLALELVEPRWSWIAHGWEGVTAVRRGELDVAEDHFASGFGVWGSGPTQDAVVGFGLQTVALRLLQGRAAEVLPLVRMSATERSTTPAWLGVRALTAAMAGEVEEADASLDQCFEHPPHEWDRDITWTSAVSTAAEAAAALGREAGAAELLEVIEPFVARHVSLTAFGSGGTYWGCLAHPAGLLCGLTGDNEKAHRLLTMAVAEHDRVRAPLFAERSRQALRGIDGSQN